MKKKKIKKNKIDHRFIPKTKILFAEYTVEYELEDYHLAMIKKHGTRWFSYLITDQFSGLITNIVIYPAGQKKIYITISAKNKKWGEISLLIKEIAEVISVMTAKLF